MSHVSKGNAAERFVAKERREQGFVVASRRHIGGAGDLLCVHPDGRVQLIEVKDRHEPWQGFRREDREEMRATPLPPGSERLMVNKRGQALTWYAESEWP
jgi:hypothetical protein